MSGGDVLRFAQAAGMEVWHGCCDRCGTRLNITRDPEPAPLAPDMCRNCPGGAVRYVCTWAPEPRPEWGLVATNASDCPAPGVCTGCPGCRGIVGGNGNDG